MARPLDLGVEVDEAQRPVVLVEVALDIAGVWLMEVLDSLLSMTAFALVPPTEPGDAGAALEHYPEDGFLGVAVGIGLVD